jgi:tRNA-intron endonuclease
MSVDKAILRLARRENNVEVIVDKGMDIILRFLPERHINRIDIIEALYLLYTGHAIVLDENEKPLSFEKLMKLYTRLNPYAWVEFEVYLDLRKRGRLPVKGPREHTFLLRRGKRAKQYTHYVLVLEENRPIKISMVYNFVEEAIKNSWQPLIAIVDRYGDITYYSVMLFHPQTLEKEEDRRLEIQNRR